MGRNVYISAVFTGGRLRCIEILPGQGRPPATILGIRKLEALGYPTVKPCPFVFLRFDRIPECDGQMDRQTDRPTDLP